jgi:hypothetical protein
MNRPVLEHWNGSAWAVAQSPISGVYDYLTGVATISAGSVLAVGFNSGTSPVALSMHWNGTAWKQVPIPSPQREGLYAVTAVPGGTAWAVGATSTGQGSFTPLIVHWNGTAWTSVPGPSPAAGGSLYGVTATSASNAWAVGYTSSYKTLVFHWNGKTWN